MDRNNLIGFGLIFGILMIWGYLNTPSQEELQQQQEVRDSIIQAEKLVTEAEQPAQIPANTETSVPDSVREKQLTATYGDMSNYFQGDEQFTFLENDLMLVKFSNKGGKIVDVILKEYQKDTEAEDGEITKSPLHLLEDERNKMEFEIPFRLPSGNKVNTADVFFQPTLNGNTLTYAFNAPGGAAWKQVYTLSDNGYDLDFQVEWNQMGGSSELAVLNWHNYLDKIEVNTTFEKNYSSVYFRKGNEDVDYCSCTGADTEVVDEQSVNWVAHSNQFLHPY